MKNLFQYYLDSRKVENYDDLIDLLVSDRIKQTLSDACIMHVLSVEGEEWYHPEKLTSVIDTFVNSRLNMSAPRGKRPIPEPRPRPSIKNTASSSNVQDAGVQNKSFHNSGFSKPPYTDDKGCEMLDVWQPKS